MPANVIVYSQPNCAPCKTLMSFLKSKNVEFIHKDVSVDVAAQKEMAGFGSMSTPTLVVNGQPLVGFNPTKVMALLTEMKVV